MRDHEAEWRQEAIRLAESPDENDFYDGLCDHIGGPRYASNWISELLTWKRGGEERRHRAEEREAELLDEVVALRRMVKDVREAALAHHKYCDHTRDAAAIIRQLGTALDNAVGDRND
jgi:hypothetical protein